MDEDKFFEVAAAELRDRTAEPGLLARAYAKTNGDERKAAAYYVNARAGQLKAQVLGALVQREKEQRQAARRARPPSNPWPWIVAVVVVFLALAMWSSGAHAAHRSSSAKAAFKREHPCPATSSIKGACPGYVIDHVTPLCAGGRDAPDNMQWQAYGPSLAKDRDERALCRTLRSAK